MNQLTAVTALSALTPDLKLACLDEIDLAWREKDGTLWVTRFREGYAPDAVPFLVGEPIENAAEALLTTLSDAGVDFENVWFCEVE